MEQKDLQRAIEAILFAAGERVELSRLAMTLEADEKDVAAAADALADEITDWDATLTPGNPEYDIFIAGMDKAAEALLELQEAGVPVIWRPFHEFDGRWFWWGKGGSENFIRLWQLIYDR